MSLETGPTLVGTGRSERCLGIIESRPWGKSLLDCLQIARESQKQEIVPADKLVRFIDHANEIPCTVSCTHCLLSASIVIATRETCYKLWLAINIAIYPILADCPNGVNPRSANGILVIYRTWDCRGAAPHEFIEITQFRSDCSGLNDWQPHWVTVRMIFHAQLGIESWRLTQRWHRERRPFSRFVRNESRGHIPATTEV